MLGKLDLYSQKARKLLGCYENILLIIIIRQWLHRNLIIQEYQAYIVIKHFRQK